jgi:hypothetical protein
MKAIVFKVGRPASSPRDVSSLSLSIASPASHPENSTAPSLCTLDLKNVARKRL